MIGPNDDQSTAYRVWIAAYRDWTPRSYGDVPPRATALEPAEQGTMSTRQAARYVEAFNRAALASGRPIWAVAVPVTIRWDGEPRPGQSLGQPKEARHRSTPSRGGRDRR